MMHNPILDLFVPGIPRPGGSKTAFAIKKGGIYTGRSAIVDASGARGKEWRQDVKRFASDAMDGRELLTGAIEVQMTFLLPRPKGHYGSGRNSETLKETAPPYPVSKPDVLKLARSAEDAMSGVVYADDNATTTLCLKKRYARKTEQTGVVIRIYPEMEVE